MQREWRMVAASIYQLCGMSAPVFIDGHGVRKSDWKLEKTFYIHFFHVIFSLHVSLSNSELKFNLLFQYAISSLHVSLSLSLSLSFKLSKKLSLSSSFIDVLLRNCSLSWLRSALALRCCHPVPSSSLSFFLLPLFSAKFISRSF